MAHQVFAFNLQSLTLNTQKSVAHLDRTNQVGIYQIKQNQNLS